MVGRFDLVLLKLILTYTVTHSKIQINHLCTTVYYDKGLLFLNV